MVVDLVIADSSLHVNLAECTCHNKTKICSPGVGNKSLALPQ